MPIVCSKKRLIPIIPWINPQNPITSRGYTFFSEVTCKRFFSIFDPLVHPFTDSLRLPTCVVDLNLIKVGMGMGQNPGT